MKVTTILGWKETVKCQAIKLEADHIQFHLATKSYIAFCPSCGFPADRIHSRYIRKLADLPWAGKSVQILLQARRFFCENKQCHRKTFAERLTTAPAYARKSVRLKEQLLQVAAQLGGRSGARLAKLLGIPVCHNTLLRGLMKLPDPPEAAPKVLGVDDWAMKKGLSYGTILVDIEKHRPIALLANRESNAFSEWLKGHPGVAIITRDRANCYAEGAKLGAPDALQVADRWHLIKNLGDALRRMLEQHNPALRAAAKQLAEQVQKLTIEQNAQQAPQNNGPSVCLSSPTALRAIRFEEAKKLIAAGHSFRAVARMLKLDRKTVRKYQYFEHYPPRHQPPHRQSAVLPYADYLLKEWNQGERRHQQLWQQIKQQGFTGHASSVYRFLVQFKTPEAREVPNQIVNEIKIKNWSPGSVQFLLTKSDKDLSEGQQIFLKVFFEHYPLAVTARKLALEFLMLLKEKKPELLSGWIQQAKTCGIAALKNFAQGLEGDYVAVKAAATYQWSNGPIEGQVNRLKTIKRQMYGRAGFSLLCKRVLYYPDTG